MVRILLLLVASFIIFLSSISGQINGRVVDEENRSMQFVNVYIDQSTIGTSTNSEGLYSLDLENGQHDIVFQFVGYRQERQTIQYTGKPIKLDVQLVPETYSLTEVTISANGEDPAYAIIRKAQAKRSYYRDVHKEYSCDVYIKGNQKVLDAPKKILGQEIGDLDGALDSNRQGIVYLSESLSKLFVKGDQKKEIITSSKVSGNDQGYSFNSALDMDISFYDNSIELGRAIVSPIARNAMSFYKYKLLGAHLDEQGYLINQIKVEPKQKTLPAYSGEIYIVEDRWNIHSLDLVVSSQGMAIPFLDSLNFKQSYLATDSSEEWVLFSNVIDFNIDAFGFVFKGQFGAVYRNYDFSPVGPEVFDNEVYFVEKGSNEKSDKYWEEIRPVPLSTEEQLDYVRKDSIRLVRESPEYLDSIDRDQNKFEIGNILSGYQRQNSKRHSSISFDSPLSHLSYNTVQGYRFQLGLSGNKSKNKYGDRRFSWRAKVDYGFSEEEWRPSFSFRYRHDRINRLNLSLDFGRKVTQYNEADPITDFVNLFESLLFRRNYMKLYAQEFVRLGLDRYLGDAIYAKFSLAYADRSSLINHADISYFYKDSRNFTSNDASDLTNFNSPYFDTHRAMIFRASFKFYPGQKVYRYPDRVYRRSDSALPTIRLAYKMGINGLGSDVDFAVINLTLEDNFTLGAYGTSKYQISAGEFLWKNDLTFIDHSHFIGNRSFLDVGNYGTFRFLSLPYYSLSTDEGYLHMSFEHDFEGFILDRIPVINSLGWQLIGSARYLHRFEKSNYTEFSLGLDNIGFGVFKLFQLQGVWSILEDNTDFRVVLGFKGDF